MSDIPGGQPPEEELDLGEIVDDPNDPPADELEEIDEEVEPLEPGEDDEPEPAAAQPRQGRRGQAERLRERLERTERDLAELRTQRQQPAAPTFDPAAAARAEQEFFASLDMMSPAEAIRAVDQRRTAQFQQALLSQQAQITDRIDKQAYDAEARTSVLHQKYRQRVEDQLRQEYAAGNLRATRTDILAYFIGQDALARAGRAAPAQRRAAAARVDGQRTRPAGARGDVAAGGRRPAADSLEADIAFVNDGLRKGHLVF